MTRYASILAAVIITVALGFQIGCDQSAAPVEPEAAPVVGKGSGANGLGDRLMADPEFREFQKILLEADRRARLKYAVEANLKKDLAFARAAEKKKTLTPGDKKRLSHIRELSEKQFQRVFEIRQNLFERFPELQTITEDELLRTLLETKDVATVTLGKTAGDCNMCYYNYNSCVASAEFRHAVEVMTCGLFIASVWGGTACYLGSLTKYLWSIYSCSQLKTYCLQSNDCLKQALRDTA